VAEYPKEQLEANIEWGLLWLYDLAMTGSATGSQSDSQEYEAVAKRVNDVITDIVAGRVIKPLRKQLTDVLDRASSSDKVHDAIGRSR
jgi:hypothetical protein